MRLHALLDALPEKIVTGHCRARVARIVHDSRQVGPGDVFVALREPSGHDGHRHIASAVHRGAAVVVQETPPACSAVTTVQVPDTNHAFALLADRRHHHPARALTLIGITGTNGKTTVACLIESILRAAGRRTGVIGTLGARLDSEALDMPLSHTTPYPDQLQALLRAMADHGARYAVMEVSSVGLAFDRISPLKFQVAVFTNLTRDHLDLHPSFDAYRAAKLRLFREFLLPGGAAVINRDDPLGHRFVAASAGAAVTYGMEDGADIVPGGRVSLTPAGSTYSIRTPEGLWPVATPLPGGFNVSNTLAAFGVGRALGIPPPAIVEGIATARAPGRLESIEAGQPFTVVVDYAHTPDALRNVLAAARAWTAGRLIAVFGCGGDRDRGKRPKMGAIASRLADYAILTSDNPRSEDPDGILREVEAGMDAQAASASIRDRREAIATALAMARDGDTVVIAGKGHEPYQDIDGVLLPFDDRHVAREILQDAS